MKIIWIFTFNLVLHWKHWQILLYLWNILHLPHKLIVLYHLMMGMHSKKCVVRQFFNCANIIEWTINLKRSVFIRKRQRVIWDRRGEDSDTEKKMMWRWRQALEECGHKPMKPRIAYSYQKLEGAERILSYSLQRECSPAHTLIADF